MASQPFASEMEFGMPMAGEYEMSVAGLGMMLKTKWSLFKLMGMDGDLPIVGKAMWQAIVVSGY